MNISDTFFSSGMLFFNDKHYPVPVTNVRRYNKVAKAMIPCWLYKPENPMEDMLLGGRENYLMKELYSTDKLYHELAKEVETSWWPF